MAQKHIVLDLETKKTFKDVGRNQLHKLKVSVAGIYDYATDQYEAYEEPRLGELGERLKTADLVIGFNVRRFDLPVLAPYLYYSVESLPVLDIMEEIEKVRGHRVGLMSVAQATIGASKTGHGLDAVRLFEDGKMEELKAYCLNDVKLTKEIFDYATKENRVYFISNRDWNKYEIPISWTAPDASKKESSFPSSLF
jgi:DEAD/DEAH box helicase domain-containing protein